MEVNDISARCETSCPGLDYLRTSVNDIANRLGKIEDKYQEVLVALAKINENLSNLMDRIDRSSGNVTDIEERIKKLERMDAELVGVVKGIQWTVRVISGIIALASSLGILKLLSLFFS